MWTTIDEQMRCWSTRLRDDLKIEPPESNMLASSIRDDLRRIDLNHALGSYSNHSPVAMRKRLDELVAFQGWMEWAAQRQGNPLVTRAQVITQNYICFVWLPESWFKLVKSLAPPSSVTKRCCRFLTDNPVRAFRNALAHANWQYKDDFSAIEFWAQKGERSDPLDKFEVTQTELNFWSALARCTAYVTITEILEPRGR